MSASNIGGYELVELLAEDALATWYETRSAAGGQRRALLLRLYHRRFSEDEGPARFQAAAQAWRGARSEGIAELVDFGIEGHRPWVVLRRSSTPSLRDLLGDGAAQTFDPASVALIGHDLARALEAAGEASPAALHQALRPASILFDREGRAQLTDFGVAESLRDEDESMLLTDSVGYQAPEASDGGEPLPSADLFSLGVCLFEALSGHLPFAGHVGMASVFAAKAGRYDQRLEQLCPDAPLELREQIESMLRGTPEDRPGAGEVAEAFARIARQLGADRAEIIARARTAGRHFEAPAPEVAASPSLGASPQPSPTPPASAPMPTEEAGSATLHFAQGTPLTYGAPPTAASPRALDDDATIAFGDSPFAQLEGPPLEEPMDESVTLYDPLGQAGFSPEALATAPSSPHFAAGTSAPNGPGAASPLPVAVGPQPAVMHRPAPAASSQGSASSQAQAPAPAPAQASNPAPPRPAEPPAPRRASGPSPKEKQLLLGVGAVLAGLTLIVLLLALAVAIKWML